MSEPKLCPKRKWIPAASGMDNFSGYYEEFGPCLQDKCAMWRGFARDSEGAIITHLAYKHGFCGLAGKP